MLSELGPHIAKKMDVFTLRWLSKTPVLMTAYLVWRNLARERRGKGLFVTLFSFMAWVAAASFYVRADRAAAASTLASLHRHELFWSTVIAIVSAILVSRRRALTRIGALRAWTSALPITRSAARWQAVASDSLPAIRLAGILAATFGGLSMAFVVEGGGITAPITTWAATTGGAVLGAALSYLLKFAAQEEIYEASRYVPHRRRARDAHPDRVTCRTRLLASTADVREHEAKDARACNCSTPACRATGIPSSRRHGYDRVAHCAGRNFHSCGGGDFGECAGVELAETAPAGFAVARAADTRPCSSVHDCRGCD